MITSHFTRILENQPTVTAYLVKLLILFLDISQAERCFVSEILYFSVVQLSLIFLYIGFVHILCKSFITKNDKLFCYIVKSFWQTSRYRNILCLSFAFQDFYTFILFMLPYKPVCSTENGHLPPIFQQSCLYISNS